MLGCSLEEAFGGIKRKKNIRNNHANIISRSKLNLDDTANNRLDEKIIINENVEESKTEIENKNNEIKNDVLNKLNTVLDRLETLENKFVKSEQSKPNIQELAGLEANKSPPALPPAPPAPPALPAPPAQQNTNNTSNLINKLNTLRNRNRNNNTNNTNNNNNNNINNNINNNNINNNRVIEGFTNNSNISYVGDQLNELLLFGLMGIFILLLFDYIYKLGKKSF